MGKGNGSTRASSSSAPRGIEENEHPLKFTENIIPEHYDIIKETNGWGETYVDRYVSKEDKNVVIVAQRGNTYNNAVTGYLIQYGVRQDVLTYKTLKEAKDAAKQYAKKGWWK